VTDSLASELGAGGSLERRIFALQAVEGAELDVALPLMHRDQNPRRQLIFLQPCPPIADQRGGAFRHMPNPMQLL
jgi:hypothetical protein